jgi:hypothetical protein
MVNTHAVWSTIISCVSHCEKSKRDLCVWLEDGRQRRCTRTCTSRKSYQSSCLSSLSHLSPPPPYTLRHSITQTTFLQNTDTIPTNNTKNAFIFIINLLTHDHVSWVIIPLTTLCMASYILTIRKDSKCQTTFNCRKTKHTHTQLLFINFHGSGIWYIPWGSGKIEKMGFSATHWLMQIKNNAERRLWGRNINYNYWFKWRGKNYLWTWDIKYVEVYITNKFTIFTLLLTLLGGTIRPARHIRGAIESSPNVSQKTSRHIQSPNCHCPLQSSPLGGVHNDPNVFAMIRICPGICLV